MSHEEGRPEEMGVLGSSILRTTRLSVVFSTLRVPSSLLLPEREGIKAPTPPTPNRLSRTVVSVAPPPPLPFRRHASDLLAPVSEEAHAHPRLSESHGEGVEGDVRDRHLPRAAGGPPGAARRGHLVGSGGGAALVRPLLSWVRQGEKRRRRAETPSDSDCIKPNPVCAVIELTGLRASSPLCRTGCTHRAGSLAAGAGGPKRPSASQSARHVAVWRLTLHFTPILQHNQCLSA